MANSIIGKLFIFPSMWGAIIMTNLSLSFVSRWVGRRTVRTSAGVDGSAAGHIYQVLGQWEAGICHCNEREVLARRVSRKSIFISELCVVDVGRHRFEHFYARALPVLSALRGYTHRGD